MKGKVAWFNDKKGYGFITVAEQDKDVFVHFSDINSKGFKSLRKDQEVEFELTDYEKGKKAIKVTILK